MRSRARSLIAPGYLLACLVLGGSAQGIWQNMILQLTGLLILTWAAITGPGGGLALPARQLLWLAIAAIAIVALAARASSSVTVASSWSRRQNVADGFSLLGLIFQRSLFRSTQRARLDLLLKIIPPLAMVCSIVCLKAYRTALLVSALLLGTVAGTALGSSTSRHFRRGPLTVVPLFRMQSGRGVGFFANADHMATLLLMSVPFLAAMIAAEKRRRTQGYLAAFAVVSALAVVIVVGVALNGSLAGYGLLPAMAAASSLILIPRDSRFRGWILVLTGLLVSAFVTAIETTAIGHSSVGEHAANAVQSRVEILSTTLVAVRDFLPFGSGLGSFSQVYPLYELWEG